jgi:hypothetical protein
MVSWDDAFLMLNKWRDDPDPPLISFMEVKPWLDRQGETIPIASGISVTVKEVSAVTGKVTLDDSGASLQVELLGATFEYSDSRDSPLIDGVWVCSLEATCPDGRVLVFAEYPAVS